jgi:glycosyltransferase involved in cell wall biosynthesis
MKILYDHQIFSMQKYGGVSRYFYELKKSFNSVLPILISNNFYLEKSNLQYINYQTTNLFFRKFFSLINKLSTIIYTPFIKYDIYHPTYYNPFLMAITANKPFVLTIHDMIHEKFPEFLLNNDPTRERKFIMAKRANKIIAVSENTKKDIVEFYGISPDKIDVIHHGDSLGSVNINGLSNIDIPEKYILYTGQRAGYKNFTNFILASKKSLLNDEKLFVVCAGGGQFNHSELQFFKKNNLFNKIIQLNCNDQKLKLLYTNSIFFIYPSLYEGFGIPLLEAMSSNTAILCSDTSCFPEVAADAAIYFNPNSILDIEKKIIHALNNDLTYLKKLGKKRLKFFSWEQAIIKTRNTYKKVLE